VYLNEILFTRCNLYAFVFAKFGRFMLIFITMELIVLQVLIVCIISRLEFHQVKLL